jgi:hypothetical protein
MVISAVVEEDEFMQTFLVTELAEQHRRDLVELAQAEHAARLVRRACEDVRPWRQRVAHVLLAASVGIGTGRDRRPTVLRQAHALLAVDDCGC